jgi:hypothetical protein
LIAGKARRRGDRERKRERGGTQGIMENGSA